MYGPTGGLEEEGAWKELSFLSRENILHSK